MTEGDKIKLRAELAGKAMQAVMTALFDSAIEAAQEESISVEEAVALISVSYADALMKELGLDGE